MAGRNDPCPCGSGKKYKKCCLRREDELRARGAKNTSLTYRWEDMVIEIHDELKALYPQETLVEWANSFGHEPLEEEEMPFMLECMAFFHPLENGQTPAQIYFGDRSRFAESEESFKLDSLVLPLSVYEITEGTGPDDFVFCDLLRKGRPYLVSLGRMDTEGFNVGDSMLGKLIKVDDAWFPISIHPRAMVGGGGVLVAKEFLGKRKSCHTSTLLEPESARRLYRLWNILLEALLEDEDRIEFCNLDEQPPSLCRDVWSFEPKKRKWVTQALSQVEGLKQKNEDTFVFGSKERKVKGIVTLKESELWIDANSYERLERTSEAVSWQCGQLLTFDKELGQDEILASAEGPAGERLSGTSMQELLEDPDVRAQLEAQLPEGVTFDHLLT